MLSPLGFQGEHSRSSPRNTRGAKKRHGKTVAKVSGRMLPQRALLPLLLFLGSGLLIGAQTQDSSISGQWTGRLEWPINGIHTTLLPTGKVLSYGRDDDARLWDPATGTFTAAARAGFNIFCTGHSLLSEGRVLLTGGHIASNTGLPNA